MNPGAITYGSFVVAGGVYGLPSSASAAVVRSILIHYNGIKLYEYVVCYALSAECVDPGYGCQSSSCSAEKGKLFFRCPRSLLKISYRETGSETGSAVPSRVSPPIQNTRAKSSIWCLLTGFLPIPATASIYFVNRHRAIPKFIGSRNCVPMAFIAESPPAQGR